MWQAGILLVALLCPLTHSQIPPAMRYVKYLYCRKENLYFVEIVLFRVVQLQVEVDTCQDLHLVRYLVLHVLVFACSLLMFYLGYLVSKYFYTRSGGSRRSKSVQGRRSRTGEDKLCNK